MQAVFFVNANTGWTVGAPSTSTSTVVGGSAASSDSVTTVLRTDDGGASWTRQRVTPAVGALRCVTFVNLTHGWAAGEGGAVISTSDGGVSWQHVSGACAGLGTLHGLAMDAASGIGFAVGVRDGVCAHHIPTWRTPAIFSPYSNGKRAGAPHWHQHQHHIGRPFTDMYVVDAKSYMHGGDRCAGAWTADTRGRRMMQTAKAADAVRICWQWRSGAGEGW